MCDAVRKLALEYPWPAVQPVITSDMVRVGGWLADPSVFDINLTTSTRLVVELGAWLGLSTRYIAGCAPAAVIISVDHWRGSPENRVGEYVDMLPTLYDGFIALCWDYRDRIIPVRESTVDGLNIVAGFGLQPDLVYIDAEHSYSAVLSELELTDRLFPGAIIVGDDYLHPPVTAAVNDFVTKHGYSVDHRYWYKILKL